MMRFGIWLRFFGVWAAWTVGGGGATALGSEADQAPPASTVAAPVGAGAEAGGESVLVREMREWGGEAAAVLQRALERLNASPFLEVEVRGRSYLMAVPSMTRREAWEREASGMSDVEVALLRRHQGGPTLEAMHSRTLGGSAAQLRGLLLLQDPAQEEGLVMLNSGEEPTPTKLRMPMSFFREDRRTRVGRHWEGAAPFVLEVAASRPSTLRPLVMAARPSSIRPVARETVGDVGVVVVELKGQGGRELLWIEENTSRVLRSVVLSLMQITELVYVYREAEAPAEGDFDADAGFARLLALERVEGGLAEWEALRERLIAYRPPAEERGPSARPQGPVDRRLVSGRPSEPGSSSTGGAAGAPGGPGTAPGATTGAPPEPLPSAFGIMADHRAGEPPIDVDAIMNGLRTQFAADRFVMLNMRARIGSSTALGSGAAPSEVGPFELVRVLLARAPGGALSGGAARENPDGARHSWTMRVVALPRPGAGVLRETMRTESMTRAPRDENIDDARVRSELMATLSQLGLDSGDHGDRLLAVELFARPGAVTGVGSRGAGVPVRALGRGQWLGRPAVLLLREHGKVALEYVWVDEQASRLLHTVFVSRDKWAELHIQQVGAVQPPPNLLEATGMSEAVQMAAGIMDRLSNNPELAVILKTAWERIKPSSALANDAGAAPGPPLDPALLGAVVLIESDDSSGSGFITELKGQPFVISNLHVVGGARNLKLTTVTGRRLEIVSTHAAAGRDLAIMRLAGADHPVRLRMPDDLLAEAKIDTPVVVAGNRRGGGVATQERGRLLGIGPDRVEVNAAFQPGNSGSPIILPETGRVIGVAAFSSKREMDDSDQAGTGSVEQRWFGFRLDGVERWEAVDHDRWRLEAKMIEDFARDTEAIFDALSGRLEEASESARVAVPIGRFIDRVGRSGNSRAQNMQEVQELLRSLRALCNQGLRELENAPTHDFFRTSEYWSSSIPLQLRARKQLAERIDEVSKNLDVFLARLRR